jgi:DNA-binding transcriptional ArsR family regulator
MRALAHPARLAILELLHAAGTANATDCARELETSPQAASYHLRMLARCGFVRRAESVDGRENRWTLVAHVAEYLAAESELEPEWRQAATFTTGSIHVTAAELDKVAQDLRELVKRYERPDPAARPEQSRRVHVIFRAVPRVERKPRRRRS